VEVLKDPLGVFSMHRPREDEVSLREWMALKGNPCQEFHSSLDMDDHGHQAMVTGSASVGHIGQAPWSWNLRRSLSMPSNGSWQAASGDRGIGNSSNLQMEELNALQVMHEALGNKTRP